jgi:hypothetical protein
MDHAILHGKPLGIPLILKSFIKRMNIIYHREKKHAKNVKTEVAISVAVMAFWNYLDLQFSPRVGGLHD